MTDASWEFRPERVAATCLVTALLATCALQWASRHFGIHGPMKPVTDFLMLTAFVLPVTILMVLFAIQFIMEKRNATPASRPLLLLPFLVFVIVAFFVDARFLGNTVPWCAFGVAVVFPIPASLLVAYRIEKARTRANQPSQ